MNEETAMRGNDFFNAAVWEKAWKDASDAKLERMKRSGVDATRSFDPKAKTFNERSFSEEGKQRTRRIMNWLEGQGVRFENASVLDIGAASGVFTVPFAERGARVTAVETSPPLVELLEQNLSIFADRKASIVHKPFEDIDVQAQGWNRAFDLVFVSMCPAIRDWESVEKALQCARKFCYISLPIVPAENSLMNEIWPIVAGKPFHAEQPDMGYLLHLLYLKGYAYESLVTREGNTKEVAKEEALQEAMTWLGHRRLPADERSRSLVADYLERTYPSGTVPIREGGRFGKVLIRLQEQNMYTKTN